MALWQEKIYIAHLHNLYSTGEINLIQLAKGMVGRLKTTSYYAESDLDFLDVVKEFEALDAYSDHEDYRIALEYLYAFGDKDHQLWIDTEAPVSKYDIHEDRRHTNINARMLDDYELPELREPLSILSKGPYYQPGVVSRAIVATTGSSSASNTTSSRYDRKKKVRYISDYEFDKRLKEKGIIPSAMTRDFYTYVRDADDDYQQWILERWIDNANIGGYVKARPEAIALDQ